MEPIFGRSGFHHMVVYVFSISFCNDFKRKLFNFFVHAGGGLVQSRRIISFSNCYIMQHGANIPVYSIHSNLLSKTRKDYNRADLTRTCNVNVSLVLI